MLLWYRKNCADTVFISARPRLKSYRWLRNARPAILMMRTCAQATVKIVSVLRYGQNETSNGVFSRSKVPFRQRKIQVLLRKQRDTMLPTKSINFLTIEIISKILLKLLKKTFTSLIFLHHSIQSNRLKVSLSATLDKKKQRAPKNGENRQCLPYLFVLRPVGELTC